MKEIFKTFDAKAISMLITSVGGILLAGFMGYLYFTTVTNHLSNIEEVMRDLSGNIKENTAVLNIIEARGR